MNNWIIFENDGGRYALEHSSAFIESDAINGEINVIRGYGEMRDEYENVTNLKVVTASMAIKWISGYDEII